MGSSLMEANLKWSWVGFAKPRAPSNTGVGFDFSGFLHALNTCNRVHLKLVNLNLP